MRTRSDKDARQGRFFSSAGRIFILHCGHAAALQTFPVFVVFEQAQTLLS